MANSKVRSSMKIIIAGATGFIGSALVKALSNAHDLTLVGRSSEKIKSTFPTIHHAITWDELKSNGQDILSKHDIVINLCGENIGNQRWSATQKKKILSSRIETTQLIADICTSIQNHPPRIINASAIGIYGFRHDNTPLSENTPISTKADCFLEEVGIAWESALSSAEQKNIPVVKMRFGVVIAQNGGALKKMLPAFSLGLGAIIGNGEQYFSWVSLRDVVRAIEFIINHPEISGPINIVSPGVLKQKDFALNLAHSLNRPLFLRLPSRLIKMIFGQMGDELLLHGQFVVSEKLPAFGFEFHDKDIKSALE